MTKHEQIIQFIRDLQTGEKISVRQIAKDLGVSEGTAYRAIKEAENQGFVSTIGRVGTIRIDKKEKGNIEKLTFAEVVNIVDGTVIGGGSGLHKTLHKFVIGAMEIKEMAKYIEQGSLLIVGNRFEAQELALTLHAAVLITGGFDTNDQIKSLADKMELPIISTSYDTFTVAALINRAIYDRLIKKEIVMVEDIIIPLESTYYLRTGDQLEEWYALSEATEHSRFPVVDESFKVQGIVTAKDIIAKPRAQTIDRVMTKHPICVSLKTSVASAAHMMIWEGIELLPVVNNQRVLLGIISRQDVLKAMSGIQKQPQIGETFEELMTNQLEDSYDQDTYRLKATIVPQMSNHMGTLSSGVLTHFLTEAAQRLIRRHNKTDAVIENTTIYYIKPVQIDQQITIIPKLIDISRKFAKVDVEIYNKTSLISKALITAKVLDK